MSTPLPPSKARFWEQSESNRNDAVSRGWRGVLSISPTLGVVAAIATVEVMAEKKRSLTWQTAKIGCARGFLYWLPIGSAAALFYGGELACRPAAAVLSLWLKERLPLALHPLVHAETRPGRLDDELPSSSTSKALAGGATGLSLAVPMHLVGWRGFRSMSSIPVMTVLASVAAVAMPDFETINRR